MEARILSIASWRGSTPLTAKKQACITVLMWGPMPASRATAVALITNTRRVWLRIAWRRRSGRRAQLPAGPWGLLSRNTPPGSMPASRSKRSTKSHWWQATKLGCWIR